MRLVIGVAPGARYTGIVLRDGLNCLTRHLVARGDTPLDWYLGDVVDAVQKTKNHARNILLQTSVNHLGSPAVLAVEDAVMGPGQRHPNHELLEAAQVVGAVAGHWPTIRIATLDEPDPLDEYPPILQARGNDRYLRIAWDLAGAAVDAEVGDTA